MSSMPLFDPEALLTTNVRPGAAWTVSATS